MWGNDHILASGGSDNVITVRSLETGSILYVLEQEATVYGLWGLYSGSYLASCGSGRLYSRCLRSLHLCSQFEASAPGWTESIWSDGHVIAWGGEKCLVSVCGIQVRPRRGTSSCLSCKLLLVLLFLVFLALRALRLRKS